MKNIDNIDQLFEDSLENLEITPHAHVKQQIQKKMFWHNLFKRKRMLLFFLATFLIASVLYETVPLETAYTKSSEINRKTKELTEQISVSDNETHEILSNPEIAKSKDIAQNNEISNTINDTKNSDVKTNNIEKPSKSLATISDIDKTDKKEDLQEQIISNQLTNNPNSNSVSLSNHKTTLESSTNLSQIGAIYNSKTSASIQNKTKANILSTATGTYTKETIQLMKSRLFQGINFSRPQEGLSLPDDTVGFDIKYKAIILPSHHWILGFNIAPNYSFSSIAKSNNEDYTLARDNEKSLSSAFYYSFGAELWYQIRELSVGTGLFYARYAQEINYTEEQFDLKEVSYWDFFETQQWNISQTPYINVDSLMQGDTTIIYKTDSVSYFVNDSTQLYRTDSVLSTEYLQKRNIYSYVEIPLMAEYSFNRGASWQPFVRAGLVTGIYIKTQSYYLNNGRLESSENLPFSKLSFWTHLSVGLRYQYNHRISFSTSLYYRYHLNNILDDKAYFKQSLDNVSFKLGAYYHF